MKLTLAMNGCLLCLLAPIAQAAMVTFDFDALSVPQNDVAISSYMTGVYGSTVTVTDARTLGEDLNPSDVYIATAIDTIGSTSFEILFSGTPILGAQMEGHILGAEVGDGFTLTAYNGATPLASYTRNDGVAVFSTGWIDFGGPADRLVISDTGRRDVGIDDLVVEPVPEPTAGLLAVCGFGWLIRRRRFAMVPTARSSRSSPK